MSTDAQRSGPEAGFLKGLTASLPIALGYWPIAFSFGVAATTQGLSALEAVMLSFVIYAGAAQFLALSLIATGAALPVAAVTLIAMNLRHVLYGPTLMREAGPKARRRFAWGWAWGLTDEVFGQALGALRRGQPFSERYISGLGLGAYAAWTSGTAIGAYAGGGLFEQWPALQAGLGFMLTALFLALLMSLMSRKLIAAVAAAGIATVAGTVLISGTSGILAGMICGALVGSLRR